MPKYIVICEEDLDAFEESINEHMDNGWRLFGEFKVIHEKIGCDRNFTYFQPMLKIDELIN